MPRTHDEMIEDIARIPGGINIVIEARLKSLVTLVKKYSPDMQLQHLQGLCSHFIDQEWARHE